MNSFLIISAITLILVLQSSNVEAYTKSSGTNFGEGIIVIEDQSTVPSGLYVSTGETYYSIVSPLLLKVGWVSVSINDNHISVLLEKGIFFFTSFSALSKRQRELLIDIRSRFLFSTTGLAFSSASTKGVQSTKSYGSLSTSSSNYATPSTPADPYGVNNQGVYQSYNQNTSPGYSCQPFNYYNVFHSPLNVTLYGDIYFLDLNGNVLDVYSRTVSYYKRSNQSILYRDHRYFVYHRMNMPLTINRIILIGQYTFLVYNDLNVLAKASWQLNPAELEVTISARSEIKRLIEFQSSAARVNTAATGAQDIPSDFNDGDDISGGKPLIDDLFDPDVRPNSKNKIEEVAIEKKVLADQINPGKSIADAEGVKKDLLSIAKAKTSAAFGI